MKKHRRPWRTSLVLVAGMLGQLEMVWAAAESTEQHETFHYNARAQRDPFVSLVRDGHLVGDQGPVSISLAKPMLSAILWDPQGKSFAIINGTEMTIGDAVGELKVIDIQRDAVVLKGGGEPVVLQIDEEVATRVAPGTTMGGAHQ